MHRVEIQKFVIPQRSLQSMRRLCLFVVRKHAEPQRGRGSWTIAQSIFSYEVQHQLIIILLPLIFEGSMHGDAQIMPYSILSLLPDFVFTAT